MEPITWDEYFMGIAYMASTRSKDTNTKVGACVVSEDNRIISTGYNGAPRLMDDNIVPTTNDLGKGWLNTKYPYVCHAELNSILNYRGSLYEFAGARVYVTLFPCNECAKALAQLGVSEIIYLEDRDEEIYEASKRILNNCGIKYRQYNFERLKIEVV